jgi:hypothetical protein
MRPAMHHRRNSAVRAGALFVSPLQRSGEPSARQVREAVAASIREFGRQGCSERIAQEFGDHPETAVLRMRWARQMAGEAFAEHGTAAAHARLFARRFAARAVHAARTVHVIRAA